MAELGQHVVRNDVKLLPTVDDTKQNLLQSNVRKVLRKLRHRDKELRRPFIYLNEVRDNEGNALPANEFSRAIETAEKYLFSNDRQMVGSIDS
ncbi:uncharacterized protein RHO25_005521 [Cercospora beticola]|uniref:Uncharacterized protein n=1 Tax=Cercospora beticola TaxID=122368 RepID=A0ABZ0NMX8_CERBT|nr:hypothetical protein RHO25_005521 [Cercospora beticola]